MSPNAHFVLYPVNRQKEINLVCVIRKKLNDKDSLETILEKAFLKKNINLANLFKGNLKSWSIYKTNTPTKSFFKNVLYVGDSFYTFPPTLAQGASQAIEAANEVFELITNDLPDIQNIYFNNRIKRTNLINKRSKLNYFLFHLSNPFLIKIRNLILKKLVKNKKFLENYLGKIYIKK